MKTPYLARLAQLVEHYLDTVGVTGSSPVSRTEGTSHGVLARGCSAAGSASPCQGEGREFESRHPLWFPLCGYPCEAVSPRWNGRVVRQRSAKPCTRVRFPFPPRVTMTTFVIVSAISSVGRALPRHGRGHWFKSSIAHTGITEFLSEFPKETGPVVFFCGCSAAGSASPCQGEGREFESRHPLQFLFGKRRLSVGRGGVRACEAYSQRSGEFRVKPLTGFSPEK